MVYDLIFIGGGPAGYEGAIYAAKRGMKVAVVEMEQLGGTCLQRGCIPTKAILHSAKLLKQMREAARSGVQADHIRFDWAEINKRKNRVVQKHTKGIELLFKQNGVAWVKGRGRLVAAGTVAVEGQTDLRAKTVVLASGSHSAELPFLKRDGRLVLSSDDLLQLSAPPASLLVVGAGAVGLEWAVIFSHLGCQVTVVEIMEQIVPGLDREIAEQLKNELIKQGVTIHTATAISAPRLAGAATLSLRQGEKEWQGSFSRVLLAVGRLPNSSGLFDSGLPIATDSKGFVRVDNNLQTGVENVFACGDLVGAPLLAHKASHQATAIAEFIASGRPVQSSPLPAALFTFPEVATVGLSEEEARQAGLEPRVGRFPYAASSRASAVEEKAGLIKVVAAADGTVVGAHILGAEAGELLPLLTYAVTRKLPADHFRELVFIHPTLGEGIWEALGQVGGFAIHL